jgi:hypothetical protein
MQDQHAVEHTAGAGVHTPQKEAARILAGPVAQYADAPAIRQHEARDVDRIGIAWRLSAASLRPYPAPLFAAVSTGSNPE